MKRTTIYLLLFLVFIGNIYGQSDSLIYKNGIWKDGYKLKTSNIKELMTVNENALQVFNSGKTLEVISYVIGCPSGFVFGYDLGTRLGGGKGNNTTLIVSGIGTTVGLIIGFAAENKLKQSVILYNSRFKSETSSLHFGITDTGGIGFIFKL